MHRSFSLIRRRLTTALWRRVTIYGEFIWLTGPLDRRFRPLLAMGIAFRSTLNSVVQLIAPGVPVLIGAPPPET